MIGLSIGWRLAQRGVRTVVLEAERARARGDRRRGRRCSPRSPRPTSARRRDRAQPRRPASAGRHFAAELERASGIDCGYRETGTLTVAVDRDEEEILRRLHELPALARPRRAVALRTGVPAPGARPRTARRRRHRRAARPPGLAAPARAGAWSRRSRAAGGELRTRCARRAARVAAGRRDGRARPTASASMPSAVVVAAGAGPGALEGLPDRRSACRVRPVKGQILRLRAQRAGGAPRTTRDPHARGLCRAARRRAPGRRRDGRGARLGPHGHRRRRARAAAPRLRGAAGHRRAGAGRDDGGPATRDARQRPDRRAGARSRACGGRPATGATASCWRRSRPRRSPTALTGDEPPEEFAPFGPRASRRGARGGADEDPAQRRAARGRGRASPSPDSCATIAADRPDGRGMAVAVDAEVVPRSAWDEVELADGQRVEVVGAIQGG